MLPFLLQEPAWTAYALGDLQPPWDADCEWQVHAQGVTLLYHGLTPPVLMALGSAESLHAAQLPAKRYQLSVKAGHLPVLAARGFSLQPLAMQRWLWQGRLPTPPNLAHLLTPHDLPSIQALLSPAIGTAEEADGFQPAQLANGIFYGVRQEQQLVAVAGTHLVSPAYGVGIVGNVYTAQAWRGRGFAQICVAQVVQELIKLQLQTIVLNVKAHNVTAQNVYRRLGFIHYCDFYEGFAQKE
ncbi:MAG TPA: GNAT family N-acetyltransferase [Anaerolineales bacterium]|nr:GNAT family N-acetyltransferase [Anaerolineales bacterium]